MEIILLIAGIIIGGGAVYFKLEPKLISTKKKDEEIEQINGNLLVEQLALEEQCNELRATLDTLKTHIQNSKEQKEELISSIEILEQRMSHIKEANVEIYEASRQLAEQQFESSVNKLAKDYQEKSEEYEKEYLETMKGLTTEMLSKIANYREEIANLETQLKDEQSIVNAAIEANKRQAEMKDKQNFYRLVLPEADITEIKKMQEVLPYLRDKEALNKVIWKVYYEKPYTDLIGRVVGQEVRTGIYKITNLENNMCYVGQAVNIADRWKQHIKRGLGAETPTRNKLYPAMAASGVENFTFEIIEECNRDKLNEKEDYWQEFFKAKEFGYSIK